MENPSKIDLLDHDEGKSVSLYEVSSLTDLLRKIWLDRKKGNNFDLINVCILGVTVNDLYLYQLNFYHGAFTTEMD